MTIAINISHAVKADVPALVTLVNRAYSGDPHERSWTAEAELFVGGTSRKRTNEAAVTAQLETAGATILKYTNSKGEMVGCVYLELQGKKLYLGMLAVLPGLQGGGVGKQLLAASEAYARNNGCQCVTMTVISLRHELVKWYERHGYSRQGTEPFPEDERFGIPTRPLEFFILEKKVQGWINL
jgi:ribosomal protein S18 acetylase RimI-like enzyme